MSLFIAVFIAGVFWAVKLLEITFGADLGHLGVIPRSLIGLRGIAFSPFVHGDVEHVYHNTVSFVPLAAGLFYYFGRKSWTVLVWITFMTGLWVWVAARPSSHIGASGVVYGLASFLFFSGLFRKDRRMSALSLTIAVFYGGMIVGIIPDDPKISWESHLFGALAGTVVALFFNQERLSVLEEEKEKDLPEVDLIGDAWMLPEQREAMGNESHTQPGNQPIRISYYYIPISDKEQHENNAEQSDSE